MSEWAIGGNLIRRIKEGRDIQLIFADAKDRLFHEGPVDPTVLEVLAYIDLYHHEAFEKDVNDILEFMGLFFKDPQPNSMQALIFDVYSKAIQDSFEMKLTPIQADMIAGYKKNDFYSFSAPTSTGKSFVFRSLIASSEKDVVVVVPSRALINEYKQQVSRLVNCKRVNVLTHVDRINTDFAERSIFILTPERARDLFKNKDWLNIEFFLFDEAQLSDERSTRGLYFDGIVRRVCRTFEGAKIIFAHPFVANPEAQLIKNHLHNCSGACNFNQRNVGQLFYSFDAKSKKYYHFGIDKDVMGRNREESSIDPMGDIISKGGSAFIYSSKAAILDGVIFFEFNKYIKMCPELKNPEALKIIEEIGSYIGASNSSDQVFVSRMVEMMRRGIVVHHGSVPLAVRAKLEQFVQSGFCRICFATSTLEQGINMPFDLVFLWRLESSKPLSVKNLIGRAGRSTMECKYDYGVVVIRDASKAAFRRAIQTSERLSELSQLDIEDDSLDEKYQEYKKAINNNTLSDNYNLTKEDLALLKSKDAENLLRELLSTPGFPYNCSFEKLFEGFSELYSIYLGRALSEGEQNVFKTAIRILSWRWQGMTFNEICRFRFSRLARLKERRNLIAEGRYAAAEGLEARFEKGHSDIPNASLSNFPLFPRGTLARCVDYDTIVFDTYDYMDRLIGFKLADLFYAAFDAYGIEHNDNDARNLALLFKFGTSDPKEILMIRYGFDTEEIKELYPCIDSISEERIEFNKKVVSLKPGLREKIEPFLP